MWRVEGLVRVIEKLVCAEARVVVIIITNHRRETSGELLGFFSD